MKNSRPGTNGRPGQMSTQGNMVSGQDQYSHSSPMHMYGDGEKQGSKPMMKGGDMMRTNRQMHTPQKKGY